MKMAVVMVLLAALTVCIHQIEAYPKYSPETRGELAELLHRMLEEENAEDLSAGADPDGIFQKCVCMTPTHTDCTCSGLIGTEVWASMHNTINAQKEASITVTCNTKEIIKREGQNPTRDELEICSEATECGGAYVQICLLMYGVEPPEGSDESPKGCTKATVTFNDGTPHSYVECFPGTPGN